MQYSEVIGICRLLFKESLGGGAGKHGADVCCGGSQAEAAVGTLGKCKQQSVMLAKSSLASLAGSMPRACWRGAHGLQ